MQINGSSLSTAFISRTNEARETVRPPVIIDAEAKARTAVRPLLPAATEATAFQTALTVEEDTRQERFVRLFSSSDESETIAFADAEILPDAVQQYLQISRLETEPQQRLFDEIV